MENRPHLGFHGGCGGKIRVSDRKDSADRAFRYEAWCQKCLECDPNGYSSVAETVDKASKYFAVVKESR
jgi:hypothetical protein